MLAPRKVLHSTPSYVLDVAFELASLQPSDLVLDVGCGDGRTLVLANQRCGCLGIGWEINPERSAEAQAAVDAAGLGRHISVHMGNVLSNARPELWPLFESVLTGGGSSSGGPGEAMPDGTVSLAPEGSAGCRGLVILLYLSGPGVRKLLPFLTAAAAARDPSLGPIRVLSYVYPFLSPAAPPAHKAWCADPENPDRTFPLFFYTFAPPAAAPAPKVLTEGGRAWAEAAAAGMAARTDPRVPTARGWDPPAAVAAAAGCCPCCGDCCGAGIVAVLAVALVSLLRK